MSKEAVRGNLTVFNADIAETHSRGLTYVLGYVAFSGQRSCARRWMLIIAHSETNSIACHGAPGVSNTAGAALWTIDYTLQAATLGIKELFFHEGVGYKYNFVSAAIFPQPLKPAHGLRDGADPTHLAQPLDDRRLPAQPALGPAHPAELLRRARREFLRWQDRLVEDRRARRR